MAETMTAVATLVKLEIIVRPGKLDLVKKALASAGYSGVTVSQAEGHGKQRGLTQGKDNGAIRMEMVPKVRLEVVVSSSDSEKILQAVCKAAQTGEPGDGKIFVSTLKDAVRIRTGERGAEAI